MFKSVEYIGFDGQSELKARAEQLTPVLADEIQGWQDGVEVLWSPAPGGAPGSLNLTLSLALNNGVSGSSLRNFSPKDLADAGWSAIRCGQSWSDLLGVVSRLQMSRIEALMAEPAEV